MEATLELYIGRNFSLKKILWNQDTQLLYCHVCHTLSENTETLCSSGIFSSRNCFKLFLIECWGSFLCSDELQLKEELKKWKERALRWRERSSRETTRETIPKSPKKAVSYFFKEQMSSPCKETVSQETVTQDLAKPLPLTCPTNFFDNSNLGVLTGTWYSGSVL